MKKTHLDFPPHTWIRTCQECGNVQRDTEPKQQGEYSTSYEFRKCKHCKSESLDYGTTFNPDYTEEEE